MSRDAENDFDKAIDAVGTALHQAGKTVTDVSNGRNDGDVMKQEDRDNVAVSSVSEELNSLTLRYYLNSARIYPLLTKDEEQALGREHADAALRISEAVHALPVPVCDAIKASLSSGVVLEDMDTWTKETFDIIQATVIRMGHDTERYRPAADRFVLVNARFRNASDRFVVHNLRLVVHIAKRYLKTGVPLLDMVQEGNIGLMRASLKYDSRRGFKFSTYAFWWVKQSIERSLEYQGKPIRIPSNVMQKLRKIKRVQRIFFQEHQRWPTVPEIAKRTGQSAEKVLFILERDNTFESLEAQLESGDDGEGTFSPIQYLAVEGPDSLDLRLYAEISELIVKSLDNLRPRERQILELRFGLGGRSSSTLEEVGERFNLTRERVRQIEAIALRKIRISKAAARLRSVIPRQRDPVIRYLTPHVRLALDQAFKRMSRDHVEWLRLRLGITSDGYHTVTEAVARLGGSRTRKYIVSLENRAFDNLRRTPQFPAVRSLVYAVRSRSS